MPKKRKHPIEEPVIFNGVVYTTKFINYDDSGKIISISNNIESSSFLEIDISLIPNFLSSKKNFNNYPIDYFKKIKEGLISDDDEIDKIIKFENIFYSITETNVDVADVIIEHHTEIKKWRVIFSKFLQEPDPNFSFFVVKKFNKNALLASYKFNNSMDRCLEFQFQTSEEENLENVEVLVYKKYRQYSLKEVK